MSTFLSGPLLDFAGAQGGKFFAFVPSYVDKSKAPGCSTLPTPTLWSWLRSALLLRHVYASPNLVWSLIALAIYFIFPYDLSPSGAAAHAPLSWAFFLPRFALWTVVTLSYNAFFHITLYGLGWAKRPFIAKRVYNLDKVAHNFSYNVAGIAMWTAFENVFAFLWATGRLAYMTDAEAFSSRAGMLRFIAGLVLVPIWRECHFYFAHRLLHFKPMYLQVHSLHHRNTDIEPFAGLCMHPVEHLYYFACVLPSLYLYASPFHFLWNGVHLLLSPGASHSGWEDHFQADAFHYMHHRYFEVNYAGFGAGFLDVFFGTFQAKFKEEGGATARDDAKSTIRGPPTLEYSAYMATSLACLYIWATLANSAATSPAGKLSETTAYAVAALAGFGPVLIACLFGMNAPGGTPMLDRKRVWASLLQLAVGTAFCSVPVYEMCLRALLPAPSA